ELYYRIVFQNMITEKKFDFFVTYIEYLHDICINERNGDSTIISMYIEDFYKRTDSVCNMIEFTELYNKEFDTAENLRLLLSIIMYFNLNISEDNYWNNISEFISANADKLMSDEELAIQSIIPYFLDFGIDIYDVHVFDNLTNNMKELVISERVYAFEIQ